MQILNTKTRYGIVSILFHWLMAILLIALIILGLYMTRLPISMQKLKLYGWHKELGMLVLWLVGLRILWRIANQQPTLPVEMPHWEKIAARTVHWMFYFLMFALPITGWLVTSAAGLPVSFFGLILIPNLIVADENYRYVFSQVHDYLAYTLIFFICLHISAALKHHFINKDDILRRIL